MNLTVGTKVIYPCQGPCVIGPVVEKVVDGKPARFYRLVVLDGRGGEVFVPLEKAQATGIRHLLKKSQIPKLLGWLKSPGKAQTASAQNWRQRTADNLKLLNSGSAFDLAKVVESLTDLSDAKTLTISEKRTLERSRELLVGEISEVMGETRNAIADQLDGALKAREKRNEKAGTKSGSARRSNPFVHRS